MRIVNPDSEDYHVHTSTFSDGWNSVDEVVKYAGVLGLTKIALTDHSQAGIDATGLGQKTFRAIVPRWKNVHNDVEVIFGVEGDLLNDSGDVCFDIQGIESAYSILAVHHNVYVGDPTKITDAYLNAIQRHGDKIAFVAHLTAKKALVDHLDVSKVVRAANDYGIPLELNGADLAMNRSDPDVLRHMLNEADAIYVNSDAHTLADLRDFRELGFQYLREEGFLES
ncbi:MAG: PHP domain-containing protein [Nanoarchaeota archaeon]|nr:PHP domain-containing protein [Nanoarchaeota archaeon]